MVGITFMLAQFIGQILFYKGDRWVALFCWIGRCCVSLLQSGSGKGAI